MTRRSATFQEVAISHCSSSHLIQEPSYSVPRGIDLLTKESKSGSASSSFSRSRSFLSCVRSLPKMALKFHSGLSASRSITSSAVTINDFDSDSADTESVPTDKDKDSLTSRGPLKQLKKVIKSASFLSKSPKSERRSSLPSSVEQFPVEVTKVVSTQSRVEGWTSVLKAAIQLDLRGDSKEALLAYCRFNRQVTKEAIYDFEMFTGDQQKLMNRLMIVLDRRIMTLKTALYRSESSADLTLSTKPCLAHDTTLRDLYKCLGLLDTIKAIGSSHKMPVVLVYRERRHRTHHRHQEKGKSNKIIFPREKREFLQFLGLPGKMITEKGIDFTVRPCSELSEGPTDQKLKGSGENSEESLACLEMKTNQDNPDKTNGDVVETPFVAGPPESEISIENATSKPPQREEKRISIVDQFLGIRKRFSVSPQRDEDGQDDNANHYRSCDTLSNEELSSIQAGGMDAISTLSCDSCSSNESSVSDTEDDDLSDTAVLANYCHMESLLPPPFQSSDETYIVLALEKIGLKKTMSLYSPFLRMSIRDCDGSLLSKEQETLTWEIINENYLRSPSSVFIHETLEQLPEDAAIFLEIRHFLQDKRKLSTLCYTFLEKSDIRSGEFVCELFDVHWHPLRVDTSGHRNYCGNKLCLLDYKPPLEFKRKKLVPYSEKAFFLHFEIRLETKTSESCSLVTLEN